MRKTSIRGILVLNKFKKFFYSKILGKKYYRTGNCLGCGRCCKKIYVKHGKNVIQEEAEFEKLKYLHRFYTYLTVVEKDETGLVFSCSNIDSETNLCKIHKNRPEICKKYPQEAIFSMGGAICEECGYKMTPIISFAEVLSKKIKK